MRSTTSLFKDLVKQSERSAGRRDPLGRALVWQYEATMNLVEKYADELLEVEETTGLEPHPAARDEARRWLGVARAAAFAVVKRAQLHSDGYQLPVEGDELPPDPEHIGDALQHHEALGQRLN